MAIDVIRQLDQETEQKLRGFYATLSEKDQRRFAAIEAGEGARTSPDTRGQASQSSAGGDGGGTCRGAGAG